jgi:aspartate ammonia-lyase
MPPTFVTIVLIDLDLLLKGVETIESNIIEGVAAAVDIPAFVTIVLISLDLLLKGVETIESNIIEGVAAAVAVLIADVTNSTEIIRSQR